MSVSINELPYASWQKRHFATHYGFFDYASLTTSIGYTELTALVAALTNIAAGQTSGTTYYQFGTNTRNKMNPASTPIALQPYNLVNWPTGCYARNILMNCTQDCNIAFITINPEYLKEYVLQNATGGQIRATAQQLIYEKEFFLIGGDYIRRFPTYGYAMIFRAETAGTSGTLRVWIEGSVEGDES